MNSKSSKNTELELRGIEAVKRFLVRKHMEILTEEPFECEAGRIAIVARDEGHGIVFVDVIVRADGDVGPVEHTEEKRSMLERVAIAFLAECDEENMGVRFDEVTVMVINDSRALLRHHYNAWGAAC